MKTIWYWHFQRVCDMLLLSIWTASYSLSWLATPYSLYHRRLFLDILTVSTYTILPSIAGGLVFFNYRDSSNRDLFNRIFYRDNKLDQILENNKYFVLGDKGTGKTAYSVFLSNNIIDDTHASIVYMGETEHGKFVRLKEQRDLILSDYTDVWRVILLLLMSDKIYKTEDRSIFSGKSFNILKEAIDDFYYSAFKPEIKSAIEFVEQAKDSSTIVFEHLRTEMGGAKEIKFSDTRFQSNLMFLEKQFINALEGIKVSKNI